MNKTEFIAAVAEKAGFKREDTKKVVNAFIETIFSELESGGKVAILGFGVFSVTEKAARNGINPRTKEPISIPARKVVKFRAGAELSDLVK
ncbi:MAG: HU family DNA-binding protein [Tannerellaceae bacterium]|jgi:DNA-binding protein HU-beta|nr:HU family DNA-binding protein [Tannerellaceae bacterium]